MSNASPKRYGVFEAIGLAESMPSMGSTQQRVAALLADEATPNTAIAKLIEDDQPIRHKVLWTVNTRRGESTKPITSVEQAILFLGRDAIGSLVRTASLAGAFKRFTDPSLVPLWQRALAGAHAARVLVDGLALGDPVEAYATGLLLNVGQMMLYADDPAGYEEVLHHAAEPGADIITSERDHLGVTHLDIGYLLARRWRLPEASVQVIRHHHAPEHAGDHTAIAATHYLADTMVTGLGVGLDRHQQVRPNTIPDKVWKDLGIEQALLRTAAIEALASLDYFDEFFELVRQGALSLN